MPRKIKPHPEKPEAAPARAVMGRPTLYRPEYCDQVLELGRTGKSLPQMAAFFDVDRVTIDNWAENNPDFFNALARAKVHAQAWWEKAAADNLTADRFNGLVWKTTMQARFRDDYTERRVNEMVGKDGGPIQTEAKILDASALSPEERDAVRAVLLMAKGKAGK